MAAQSSLVSAGDYLAGELVSEQRHEFVAGSVYAMAGASMNHGLITRNLASLLSKEFDDGPCLNLDQDIKVRVKAANAYYYPDQSVSCPPNFVDRKSGVIDNPTVLFEVLSARTEGFDRGAKFAGYRMLESLRDYVLIASESPTVEVHSLENGAWVMRKAIDLSSTASIPSVNIQLSLAQLYRRCIFDGDQDD